MSTAPGEQPDAELRLGARTLFNKLTDLNLYDIGDGHYARILAHAFSDGEVHIYPLTTRNQQSLHLEWERLRQAGLLRPELEDEAVYMQNYAYTLAEAPTRLTTVLRRKIPPEIKSELEDLAAHVVSWHANRGLLADLGGNAGVQVSQAVDGTYELRTLSGLTHAFEPQTRTVVVEHAAGVMGGVRRVEEWSAGLWDEVYLSNRLSFPARLVRALTEESQESAARSWRVHTPQLTMGGLAVQLAQQGVRADMVILAKMRVAGAEEVQKVLAHPEVIRAGGVLVVSDFIEPPEPGDVPVDEVIAMATAQFGSPVASNEGTITGVGGETARMKDAVFVAA